MVVSPARCVEFPDYASSKLHTGHNPANGNAGGSAFAARTAAASRRQRSLLCSRPCHAGSQSMLSQAADFRAEAEELHQLLVTLTDADWTRSTLFKQWTTNDIVQHLHDGD